ncbi:MAG: hypothetical protein OEN02_09785 [Gammaproteobacteria bacterium]|nr:hypothetical protein [Gammaproteobacteria bacterium]
MIKSLAPRDAGFGRCNPEAGVCAVPVAGYRADVDGRESWSKP